MGTKRTPKQLDKFLAYVLGRRPDEFGLVPDESGCFKIKDVIKALNEESGFSYVRHSHLNEVMLTLSGPSIDIQEDRIRARNTDHLPGRKFADDPPVLLYTCVRRKAYKHVLEKGITPQPDGQVILAVDQTLALRLGRRRDREPVLLTVQTREAQEKGVVFTWAGELIVLATHIPVGCFTGPALPKERAPAASAKPAEKVEKKAPSELPGSFIFDLGEDPVEKKRTRRQLQEKEIARRKARRQERREKRERWRR